MFGLRRTRYLCVLYFKYTELHCSNLLLLLNCVYVFDSTN